MATIVRSAPVALLLMLVSLPVWANHDAVCGALPTSAQRAGTRPCNPRQDCLSATPRNPACNALSTSASCPTVENYNPRQECLAKLPPVPPVGITSVEGGAAGSNRTYAGRPDVMRVRGQNVGMAGNTAVGEAGLVVGLVAAPNCAPPDCVGLAVQSALNAEGTRRFQVRAWHGHSQAEGTVQVAAAPPPQTPTPPPVAVPAAPRMPHVAVPERAPSSTGKLAAPFTVPGAFSSPIGVDHVVDLRTGQDRNPGRNDLDCRNYQGRPFPACYTLHPGSDFMMIGGFATMDAGSLDVIAAAPGAVKEIAEGNFDRCFFDPRQPDHINCQGGQKEDANFVDILQDDGLVARYFHLKRGTVLVRRDQRVECGQALGKVGSSGRSSAPHLHFELRRGGEIVDPYAEGLWISLDARNVPNGRCPGATAVTPPKVR